jgi:hypothetical protein
VVAIGWKTSMRLAGGIITALSDESEKDGGVETDISLDDVSAGSPLMNTGGHIVGIATRASREEGLFLAIDQSMLYNADINPSSEGTSEAN